MAGPIYGCLAQDHARLDALLRQAIAAPGEVDRSSYAAFRAGLLRHIGMEEKILLPAARRARGGVPLPVAARLRRDHAAFAALLVPTPTAEIVGEILGLLEGHNALEEGVGGLYESCDELLAAEAEAITSSLRAAPEVRVAPYSDGPRVRAHIQTLLDAARGGGPPLTQPLPRPRRS